MGGELSYGRLLCATRLPGAFFLFSMFSTDKNIESLASLIEKFKEYLQLRKSLLQLSLTEKIIRLLTACALTILLAFFFFLVVIFLCGCLCLVVVCAALGLIPDSGRRTAPAVRHYLLQAPFLDTAAPG